MTINTNDFKPHCLDLEIELDPLFDLEIDDSDDSNLSSPRAISQFESSDTEDSSIAKLIESSKPLIDMKPIKENTTKINRKVKVKRQEGYNLRKNTKIETAYKTNEEFYADFYKAITTNIKKRKITDISSSKPLVSRRNKKV